MLLTERQQMNLDTESATHARMEAPSRPSQKYVLLQVWCGLLTVALVVMAAFLTSIKPKSAEGMLTSQDSGHTSVTPTKFPPSKLTPSKLTGSSPSFIQLIMSSDSRAWQVEHRSESRSLDLRDNSINCTQTSLYFLYAQVTFSKHPRKRQTKYVILKKNTPLGWSMKKLVEGRFPRTTESSVWVAKIVMLKEGDSISLEITDDFLNENTFWGAYQLQ